MIKLIARGRETAGAMLLSTIFVSLAHSEIQLHLCNFVKYNLPNAIISPNSVSIGSTSPSYQNNILVGKSVQNALLYIVRDDSSVLHPPKPHFVDELSLLPIDVSLKLRSHDILILAVPLDPNATSMEVQSFHHFRGKKAYTHDELERKLALMISENSALKNGTSLLVMSVGVQRSTHVKTVTLFDIRSWNSSSKVAVMTSFLLSLARIFAFSELVDSGNPWILSAYSLTLLIAVIWLNGKLM